MTDRAQGRWLALVGVRIAGTAGAILGLVLIARAYTWPQKALGVAIVLSALLLIAVVPKGLAHRWRTPEA